MAGISSLPERRARSSGARNALRTAIAAASDGEKKAEAEVWTEYLLTELWMLGFKIVPLEPGDERTG